MSDNGPVKRLGGSAGNYRGGKGDPWEGGHRVPGIFYMPGTIKAGSICDQTAMTFDLFPTMLDMAKVSYDDSDKKLDGISLLPVFKGEKIENRSLFWGTGKKNIAVRNGKWKLVRLHHKDGNKFYLFDMSVDPYEKNDLSANNKNIVQKLNGEIVRWSKSVYSEVPDQFAKNKKKVSI